jgi:hypothetical protein
MDCVITFHTKRICLVPKYRVLPFKPVQVGADGILTFSALNEQGQSN